MYNRQLLKCIKLSNTFIEVKEVTHSYNLRNGLICGSYEIKTVRYGTEIVTYIYPKMSSIIPHKIRESTSLETPVKKSSCGNQIVVHVAFAKNTLQMLTSLIFHEFQQVNRKGFSYIHIYTYTYIYIYIYIYPHTHVSSFPGLTSLARVNDQRATDVTRVLKALGADLCQEACGVVNEQKKTCSHQCSRECSMNKFRAHISFSLLFLQLS